MPEHLTANTESVGNDGTLRRSDNVHFPAEDKDSGTDNEHAETEEVSRPEIGELLHVGSGETRERSEVDTPVKDHVDSLDGDGWVNDDALSVLGVSGDDHLSPLVLVGNEGSNIGFDTASAETNDNQGSDEAANTDAVMFERSGKCRHCEDEKTDHVNTGEDENGVVFSKVLISDDGAENWSHW